MSEVLTERDGAVLTITLNRPDVFNVFNAALHDDLHEALEEASSPDVRAVVITGAGRGFCSGQDRVEFQEAPGSIRDRLEQTYHPNIRLIRALEKPVIAADGRARVPVSLAAACDIRIAAAAATFVPGFIGIGDLLTRAVFAGTLVHRAGFGARLRVDDLEPEAHRRGGVRLGLVSEVVEGDGLAARADESAGFYAALPTRGVGLTRRSSTTPTRPWRRSQSRGGAAGRDRACRLRPGCAGVPRGAEPCLQWQPSQRQHLVLLGQRLRAASRRRARRSRARRSTA